MLIICYDRVKKRNINL